jgi:hypothetical protein
MRTAALLRHCLVWEPVRRVLDRYEGVLAHLLVRIPESYLFEERVRGLEFWILPDRNLASRIARVGWARTSDPIDA